MIRKFGDKKEGEAWKQVSPFLYCRNVKIYASSTFFKKSAISGTWQFAKK